MDRRHRPLVSVQGVGDSSDRQHLTRIARFTCRSALSHNPRPFLLLSFILEMESLEMVILGRGGKTTQRVELSRQIANVWLMVSLLNSISPTLSRT